MSADRSVVVAGGSVLRRRDGDLVVEPADVVVHGDTIHDVAPPGSRPTADGDAAVIDAAGRLVLPGLVNAHTHSYATLARGMFDGLPLEPWVPYVATVTQQRTWREGYVAAMLGCIESVRTGTTAVLDHLAGTTESLLGALQAYTDAGVRVALAPMISDLPPHETVADAEEVPPAVRQQLAARRVPRTDEVVAQVRSLLEGHRPRGGTQPLATVLVGPSGPQRCSRGLLQACRDLALEFDTGIHTHLLETRAQQRLAEARYGRSMVAELAGLGLLSARFSGAHAVWTAPEDLAVLASAGATLVHNPWSNLVLGSGVAPLGRWRDAGVATALGSDGVNCGGNHSMFRVMNLAAALHRSAATPVEEWITPDDVLRAATEGGARALRLDGVIGRLEPGYQADLVVVDTAAPAYVPPGRPVPQAVLGETGANVETVMIAGRTVLERGRLLTIDEHAVVEEGRDMVAGIIARNADLQADADLQRQWLLDVSRAAHAPADGHPGAGSA